MSFSVVGIGEVLWDLLPGGRQMGGAPANVACQAAALGARACLISRVGRDPAGDEILARLRDLGVRTDCLQVDPTRPTGTVSVELASDGQPRFTIHTDVAWDALEVEPPARSRVALADAVCFGTLAQRSRTSRETILSLLRDANERSLRIFDVNLRQHFYTRETIEESLALANGVKVNDAELPLIAGLFDLKGDEREQLTGLAGRFELRAAACTRGANGSLLMREGCWSEHPAFPTKIVDTVGAGDAFTAAMTLGLLAGWDLDDINRRANEIAAFVCSQPGATPALPRRLIEPFLKCGTTVEPPESNPSESQ